MNIEEAIKMLKTAVENDKEHRIISIYDKKPLLRDAIEVVLKALEDKRHNMQVVYGGRRFGTEGMVVKDYISKDKIREKIKELEEKQNKKTITFYCNSNDITRTVITNLNELLEED